MVSPPNGVGTHKIFVVCNKRLKPQLKTRKMRLSILSILSTFQENDSRSKGATKNGTGAETMCDAREEH